MYALLPLFEFPDTVIMKCEGSVQYGIDFPDIQETLSQNFYLQQKMSFSPLRISLYFVCVLFYGDNLALASGYYCMCTQYNI